MPTLEEHIEQRFKDNEKLSSTEHKLILNKIDNIDKRFSEKIGILEKSSKEFQTYKNYIIGIVILISFVAPLILNLI